MHTGDETIRDVWIHGIKCSMKGVDSISFVIQKLSSTWHFHTFGCTSGELMATSSIASKQKFDEDEK